MGPADTKKEEIIIRWPQNSNRYDFLLTLDGLTTRLNDNGSVDLLCADNTVIYEIPAPYMYDAAGTAYIADATGQIRIVNSILGYSSSINLFSLGIVYNSDYFAYDASADYRLLGELGLNMFVGSGWRLSCVEIIKPEKISKTTYQKYYDKDGLGLKIVNKSTNAYEMTHDHGNKWTFTNSFLTATSDETGNQILI